MMIYGHVPICFDIGTFPYMLIWYYSCLLNIGTFQYAWIYMGMFPDDQSRIHNNPIIVRNGTISVPYFVNGNTPVCNLWEVYVIWEHSHVKTYTMSVVLYVKTYGNSSFTVYPCAS